MRARTGLRQLIAAFAIAGVLCVVSAAAYQWGARRELAAQRQQATQQIALHAQGLEQLVDRYRALPQLLAMDPELRAAAAAPPDAAAIARINRRLEAATRTTRASTLTLIDLRGVAVAASNWRLPSSNVGQQYGFRPYVTQAMAEGQGRFYGIGVTTGVPGYFLSEAVRDAGGRIVGVLAIKIELSALEREWLRIDDVVLVSDAHGVVFLASQPRWRYRTLRPLDAAARAQLAETRQYEGQALRPFRERRERAMDGGTLVRIEEPALPGEWLRTSVALPEPGWTLHLLHDAGAVGAAAWRAAVFAGTAWLALVFLLLFAQQRRRIAHLRRRSRADMETLVEQHARELRTARDGLVEAAQQADTGLSRQLEHLPQGVVIVDADQRLVAWNSRYLDLFRFPPDLIRVGQPIEEIFRFNARRGLLGPGPVEEAIARRITHLRSGKPHMRESEKDDGTVLEIRGNPLPDGGFVTSYADITSYKATARELRSLADALEARIADRTEDLDRARAAAVEANRYKTRFVAAAVHDLLQPLNAARMFLSSLRARVGGDAEGDALAGRVAGALAAQDAILSSLLDISRLESGTLQTRERAIALGPLLEALARDAGVLARARGLRFDAVPVQATVRTDPDLLRRIVQNFLSNAIRYTAQGRIVLGCRRTRGGLRIEVHDTGPGIPRSRHREVFEEFRRLDDGVGDERGAGLGLAIVDRIARRLGHPVRLRSTVGRGSVFSVEVPFADGAPFIAEPTTHVTAAGDDGSPLRGIAVWWIGDDDAERAAIDALLRRWDCVPQTLARATAADIASDAPPPAIVLLSGGTTADDVALLDVLATRWGVLPPVVRLVDRPEPAAAGDAPPWRDLARPVRAPALRALMTQALLLRA